MALPSLAFRLFLLLALHFCSVHAFHVPTSIRNLSHPILPLSIISPPDTRLWHSLLSASFPTSTASSSEESACLHELKHGLNHFLNQSGGFAAFTRNSALGINELGSYTNCLKDGGRYFVLVVNPLLMNGLCFPASCRTKDLGPIRTAIADILAKFLPIKISESNVMIVDVAESSEQHSRVGTMGVLTYVLLGIMLGLCIIGTVVSVGGLLRTKESFVGRLSDCFNTLKNARSIVYSENAVDPNLDVLNGVRVLSMGWVVLGHAFQVQISFLLPLQNPLDVMEGLTGDRSYTLVTSGTFSVDVFFFLTAFLGIMVCEHELKKAVGWAKKGVAIVMLYIYRAVRLWPLYGLAILIFLHLLKTLYDGPMYFEEGVVQVNSPCYDDWFYNMIFVNNFITKSQNTYCMPWSWYMANDFQMYLLIPFFCLLYSYRKSFAYIALAGLFILTFACQIFVFRKYDISVDIVRRKSHAFWNEYYDKPYCRAAPFLLGILFAWMYQDAPGSAFGRLNRTIKTQAWLRYPLYMVGISLTSLCVFCYFDFYKTDYIKSLNAGLIYSLLSRPLFVLGMMCIIYPAMLGKAALVRVLLGHELWTCLAKITYAAYLFHAIVGCFYYSSRHQSVYFTKSGTYLDTLEITVLSYALAFVLSLIVECPLTQVSKMCLRSGGTKRPLSEKPQEGKSKLEINS